MTPRAAPLPPDERRRRLVEATLPLLVEHGRGVTSRQIAEAAGVAEGTVFRAFESKDLALMQKVRPGLSQAEVRRLRDAFDQSREYQVSLKVDSLQVTGDEAVVKGRRLDNLVSKSGQSFRNESSFTFKLRRKAEGWIIDAVN